MSTGRIVTVWCAWLALVSLGCAQVPVQNQNPLGGKVQILCLDEKTGKLVDCPSDEHMECHEEEIPKGKDL